MSFTFFTAFGQSVTSGTTVGVFLPSAPIPGDCFVAGVCGGFGRTLLNVKDENGNTFTISPNSPSSVNDATSLSAWTTYLLVAPSNIGRTITATFDASVNFASISVQCFHVTGAAPSFDKDIAGNGSVPANTPVTTPSITPVSSGCLLYAVAAVEQTVDNAGTYTPWTQGAGTTAIGTADEFITNSGSSAVAVNFPMVPGFAGHYDTMAMSITQAALTTDSVSRTFGYRLS